MTRPNLNPIPIAAAIPPRVGTAVITMSVGQWDALLEAAYLGGWLLLELDDAEQPVAAYRLAKPAPEPSRN